MKAIINSRIVTKETVLTGHVLVYDESGIQQIVSTDNFQAGKCRVITDGNGYIAVPGFINEHIHGLGGVDVMDDDPQALAVMAKRLPETGVTAFLPTTMTYDPQSITRALTRIRRYMKERCIGAKVLGAHMEGPFINDVYKGAQKSTHIVKADFSFIEPFIDTVRIVTLAPETLPDNSFLEACKKEGIIVSVGHSAATYEKLAERLAGLDHYHVTHLYNAQSPLHHRKPGVVGAALTDERAVCELICDDVHLHPAAQRLAYIAKGRNGIILITDSIRACLTENGESELGGQKVFVHENRAELADGTLAGSVLTMADGVRRFMHNTGASLPEAVAAASLNVAVSLGLDHQLGSLEVGKAADIVLLDEDTLQVKKTIIDGTTVFSA